MLDNSTYVTSAATPLQIGMIYHALAHPDSGVDIEHVTITLEEDLDFTRFLDSWQRGIERYAALRTDFDWQNTEKPIQRIHERFALKAQVVDWSGVSFARHESELQKFMFKDRTRGFRLNEGPLMRLYLIKNLESHTCVLWSFHHAILDGRSFPIVLKDVFDRYDNQEQSFSSQRRPFSDYVTMLDRQDTQASEHFWREHLAAFEGLASIPESPTSCDDFRKYSKANSVVQLTVSKGLSSKLLSLAKWHGTSVHTVLQSAWALLLHHYSGKNDIVFGSTRALRHSVVNAESMAGLLINTVPFRIQFTKEMSLKDLLLSVSEEQLILRQGETSALADIQNYAGTGSSTLFDTLVVYDTKTLDERMHAGPSAQPETRRFHYQGQTNYPLTLLAYGESELTLQLEYKMEKYNKDICHRLLEQMVVLFNGFVKQHTTAVTDLSYLTETETKTFDEWNQSSRPYNLNITLQQLFESQVEKTPESTAIRFFGESICYTEFNIKANKLAHYLRGVGVQPDDLVGLFTERSIDMLVGIYATLKAGGAYVPLDPDFPIERLDYMLKDSGVQLVLTQSHLSSDLPSSSAKKINLDKPDNWEHLPVTNPVVVTTPNNLAYMLYTSGSTGKPKGVMNEHRGVVNRLLWMQEAFKLTPDDAVLQKTPFSFDVSVWELFWPLQTGARLVIAKPTGHKDTEYLADIIEEESITTVHFVPSMLQLYTEVLGRDSRSNLRRVVCSGEALSRDLQNRFFSKLPNVELHNLYGPTEAAIDVTWWPCDPNSTLKHVPIGRTIANTQIHILDTKLQQVPVGVAGELHIAGAQVARGYRNLSQLTSERFVENPFNRGSKMYKTGDLARYMPDGVIEYLGRLDFQVKIRGFRIELGEIESALTSHSEVDGVVVTAISRPAKGDQLVAYVVGKNLDINELKVYIGKSLASYMVPSEWVVLDHIPLNSSGKVDRNNLPEPSTFVQFESNESSLPENSIEERVATIWNEVLDTSIIGVNTPFFDVGGNSLLLIRLSNRLSQVFGRKVQIPVLFREMTIAKQAVYLSATDNSLDEHVHAAKSRAQKQKAARSRRKRPISVGPQK